MPVTRRQFLGTSAAAVLAAGVTGRGTVFGANDRVRVACVGINGMGGGHIRGFSGLDDAEVVALCDVDRNVLEERARELEEQTGKAPKKYVDVRDVMADGDVDAVAIATPNHWHSLAAVWACQAGKDVYVEKPLSHNVWEGRQLVLAAQKHNRIVQHGTQNRANPSWIRAMQRLRAGVIGEVYYARALCYKGRGSIGFGVEMAPPEHLNWTLWQGPAREQPYVDYEDKRGGHGIYVHYNWHWFWKYGNGDIGNQGVHQMDVASWGLGRSLPVKVSSMGGRFTYVDQAETPNTQLAQFEYPDGAILAFEVRGRATNDESGVRIGNLFYGSEGYMVNTTPYDGAGNVIPDEGEGEAPIPFDGNRFASFIKAVRTRDNADVAATALDGHVSSALCHIANIAHRTGRTLTFDPLTERFGDDEEANALLKRDYREGFEVPEIT